MKGKDAKRIKVIDENEVKDQVMSIEGVMLHVFECVSAVDLCTQTSKGCTKINDLLDTSSGSHKLG